MGNIITARRRRCQTIVKIGKVKSCRQGRIALKPLEQLNNKVLSFIVHYKIGNVEILEAVLYNF